MVADKRALDTPAAPAYKRTHGFNLEALRDYYSPQPPWAVLQHD
jgi:hypothetical protein